MVREKATRLFQSRIGKILVLHNELLLAVINKKNQAALETMLAEQLVMSCGVLWEAFLHDLIVTYISRRPSTALRMLTSRVNQSVLDKFGSEVARRTRFEAGQISEPNRIEALLDPKRFNITASSSDVLARLGNQYLAPKYARRFSLETAEAQFVDYVLALRNFLAHRSLGARESLKNAIAKLSEPANTELRIPNLRDVGVYLKTRPTGGLSRAQLVAERLSRLAGLV